MKYLYKYNKIGCVEPPGLEPGITACKAVVLANYTMTPSVCF